MYTKIPMFKEIILSSFYCDHCGMKNTEVQFSGKLADTGVKYVYKVTDEAAINRSIVKSEYATIRIPELDFEIPPQTQKGSINTVEGFIARSIEGISALQEERRRFDPAIAAKLDEFIAKLTQYQEGKVLPFTFEVIDPSGNSFIQNPNAPHIDENLQCEKFQRSLQDYAVMGYPVNEAELLVEQDKAKSDGLIELARATENKKAVAMTKQEQDTLMAKMSAYAKKESHNAQNMDFSKPVDQQDDQEGSDVTKEALSFPSDCYACTKPGQVKMCVATIPYFKEIIIMAFSCEYCGNRNSEIKQGGGISEKATKITFEVVAAADLNRDMFKSDTTYFGIPELGLELQPGTLGSVYTTVEGLLDKIITHLDDTNPFGSGDSDTNKKFVEFLASLRAMKDGTRPFTFVLDDPLSNCFIYNPKAPEDDPQIKIEVYDRTWEMNEDLGINDMNV